MSWGYNANLGRFTNFVNLLDMAGIAVPSGLLHCERRPAPHHDSQLPRVYHSLWPSCRPRLADPSFLYLREHVHRVLLNTLAEAPSSCLYAAGTADGSDAAGEARRAHLAETGCAAPVLPFGVTLLGVAWSDEYLWGVAAKYCHATGIQCGPAGHGLA